MTKPLKNNILKQELLALQKLIYTQRSELKLEHALEVVRAKTMAMHKSVELAEAAKLLFQQVQELGLPVLSCGYNIWQSGETICTGWMSDSSGSLSPPFRISLTETPTNIY